MDKWVKDSINATKKGFEKSFSEGVLYNTQTQDEKHIETILNMCNINQNTTVLDLGTGSGYLAFNMAKRYRDSKFTGLDIVEKTLEDNRKSASENGINNIDFVSYDGITFPFEDDKFDFVTTRYALHHFPDIKQTFSEVSRVTKKGGYFFISDPTINDIDNTKFVDDYMRMKKDGHIKYYSKKEFINLAENAGFKLDDYIETEITFPRLKETAIEFDDIMKKHDNKIIESYNVRVTDDNKYIYITEKVLNLLFKKK